MHARNEATLTQRNIKPHFFKASDGIYPESLKKLEFYFDFADIKIGDSTYNFVRTCKNGFEHQFP